MGRDFIPFLINLKVTVDAELDTKTVYKGINTHTHTHTHIYRYNTRLKDIRVISNSYF